jgi:hypothetical protein
VSDLERAALEQTVTILQHLLAVMPVRQDR